MNPQRGYYPQVENHCISLILHLLLMGTHRQLGYLSLVLMSLMGCVNMAHSLVGGLE